RGPVDGALHRGDLHQRTEQDPGAVPRLVHRGPAGRAGHGPGVRPSTGRQVRDEAPVRERGLGDLLHPRPPGAPVQAGHLADPGGVRGTARADGGGHREGQGRRGQGGTAVTETPISVAELLTDPAGVPRARAMLQRAEWAGRAFARYDKPAVDAIVRAAAAAGAARGHDYVTPRVDAAAKVVEVPRPAGVVLALTPSTNPVATVFFKCLLALMTRSVVVVSPHPMAKEVCADAARALGEAAVKAGAPDGVIQVVDEPSVPLIDALMTDERTSVIVATG